MYHVDVYAKVRRFCFVEGHSSRHASRVFGLSRETVRKMLTYSEPPGYRRNQPVQRPVLGPFTHIIDAILEDDKLRPKKQRHTAKRIFDRIREEHDYPGKYGAVKTYVREKRIVSREMFIPLSHAPGHGQADFGEALAVMGGIEMKIHFLCISLPHSDGIFIKSYPAETTEAFLDGHNAGFDFFGGVPASMLYDNTKLAVARILGDGKRKETRAFTALRSHYLFAAKFGRPGKGNDKGKVEGLVGYARRNFMVPMPEFDNFDALNSYLLDRCKERMKDTLRGHKESIEARFTRDRNAFLPLPPSPYDACAKIDTRVSSLSLVRYKSNDYSVPVAYGHREVHLRAYVHEVVISCGTEEIARHKRSYEKEDFIYNPLHYLPLLEMKTGALDQAAPLQGWELPEEFMKLRSLLEARMGEKGKREYVQVLRLLEVFKVEELSHAVREALRLCAISFDAVKHLVLCHIDRRPPKLNLDNYPHLPSATVSTTKAADYMSLIS